MPKAKPSDMGSGTREERRETRRRKNEKYTEFDDKRIQGEKRNWRFDKYGEDTAQAQYEFFGNYSNYNDLINKMDYAERMAFEYYWTAGHFMWGQQYGKFSDMTEDDQKYTRIFDKYLDNATLEHGLTVKRIATAELILGKGNKGYKNDGGNILKQLQAMIGQQVYSKGNMSTAAAGEGLPIAPDYADDKAVEYTIRIPKGSKGAGMWIGDKRINDWGSAQREYMMNRDTYYRVNKVSYNKGTGRYNVEIIYTGLGDHDYS